MRAYCIGNFGSVDGVVLDPALTLPRPKAAPGLALAKSLPVIDGIRSRKSCSHQTCMGLFLSRGFSPRGWAVDPLIVRLGLLTVLCSERERPFFVPSPAIRFPERAEGVKGDRNASAAWRLAALASLVFRSALTPEHTEGR